MVWPWLVEWFLLLLINNGCGGSIFFFDGNKVPQNDAIVFVSFWKKKPETKKQVIKWMHQVVSTVIWLFWNTQQVRNLTACLTAELPCTRAPCARTSRWGWDVPFVSSPLPPAGLSGSTPPKVTEWDWCAPISRCCSNSDEAARSLSAAAHSPCVPASPFGPRTPASVLK